MIRIPVAIIGASGYTGLELVKMILNHPHFTLEALCNTEGGVRIDELHPCLNGVCSKDVEKFDAEKIALRVQLAFLALPHKSAMQAAKALLSHGVKVIDLSADYRLTQEGYEKNYCPHSDVENLAHAVYGIPELWKNTISQASLIANPGCYPTATLLALAPFLPFIDEKCPLFIDAKSGVSGAGKSCTEKTHFVNVNENFTAYNPISHRHSIEISEKLSLLSQQNFHVNFVPHLLPITRGMLSSCYATLKEEIDPIAVLEKFYGSTPFVRVRHKAVELKAVAGTHFGDVFAMCNGKALIASCAIDNLLRGASSQALANANLMYGFDESLGLPKIAYVP